MKKLIAVLSLVFAFPMMAMAAQDNVGGCGVGSMVFKGQSGVGPQVLAVTTNGISGNRLSASAAEHWSARRMVQCTRT